MFSFNEINWTDFTFLLSQAVVLSGFVALTATYFLKNRKTILLLVLYFMCCLMIGFGLLGAWAGFGMYVVLIVRAIYNHFFAKKLEYIQSLNIEQKKRYQRSEFIILCVWSSMLVIISIFTAHTFLAWFAFLATFLFLISIWQKNIGIYRWLGVIVSVLWIVYNGYVGNLVGFSMRFILLAMGIVGVIMLYTNKESKKKMLESRAITGKNELK